MKRLICALLALVLSLSICAASVFAADSYTLNGVRISYTSSAESTNCWAYANDLYSAIWGYRFSCSRKSDDNMLRQLSQSECSLTVEHLKAYVRAAKPGAVLRLSPLSHWDGNDEKGHSQIICESNENGFTVFESNIKKARRVHTYTWSDFCSFWGGEKGYMIKYIKYKNAPCYSAASYTLDVNGWLDNSYCGNLSNYGLFDIEIGGVTYQDRTDFYGAFPSGTSFRIYNVRSNGIHDYQGVRSNSGGMTVSSDQRTITGTISGENKQVLLQFRTNNLASEYKSSLGDNFFARIRCKGNGLYLYEQDDYNITVLPMTADERQVFHFEKLSDNLYRITACSGRVLDVEGAGAYDGVNLRTWEWNASAAQRFAIHIIDGAVELSPACTFCVVDAGQPVSENYYNAYMLHHMDQNGNQLFELEPVDRSRTVPNGNYTLISAMGNYAVDVSGATTQNGGKVQMWESHLGLNQQVRIVYLPNGLYRILFLHSDLALEVYGASKKEGTPIAQWDFHQGLNQLWRIEPNGDGTYRFVSADSGLVLDVYGGQVGNGKALTTWSWRGGANQRFYLKPV